MHKQPELIDQVVKPAALELCEGIMEDMQEALEQLKKQATRIVELRKKRDEEPGPPRRSSWRVSV